MLSVSRVTAAACVALVLAIAAGGLTVPAHGQTSTLSGFSLLRLDPSARGAALGGAQSALWDEEINSFFSNPALLNYRTDRALSVTYLRHVEDIQAGFISYGREIEGIGHFGGGLRFITFGSIEAFDEDGFAQGTFGAGDVVGTVGYARPLSEQVHVGANLHVGYSHLEEASATALMLDLGAAYQIPAHRMVLSASVSNLGFAVDRYYEAPLNLPLDVRLGLARRLAYLPITLVLDAYELQNLGSTYDDQSGMDAALQHIAAGAEVSVTHALHVRLGYSHRHQRALDEEQRIDAAGFSIGFGLDIERLRFDYAYRSWAQDMGGLHQFTLRTWL